MNSARVILCLIQKQEAVFFAHLLGRHGAPMCLHVDSAASIERAAMAYPGSRLIAFSTDVIVPGSCIKRLQGNCLNFHLGPPERPGFRPAAFAARDRAHSYGVTFHQMIARVDAGPIHAVTRFDLSGSEPEEEISTRAYLSALDLAARLAPVLADPGGRFALTDEHWGAMRTTRRQYQAIFAAP